MRSITLLQLGDIHFPGESIEKNCDIKDSAFPPHVSSLLTNRPLMAVIRRAGETQADAVLICGDLTSFGNIDYYDKCVSWLVNALKLGSRSSDSVHVVPGNHDVDRSVIDPSNLYQKFQPFSDLWSKYGLPILTVQTTRTTKCVPQSGAGGVEITSINSSLGCGERWFPKAIREEFSKALDQYTNSVDSKVSFEITGHSLDTPAIKADDILCMCDNIRGLDPMMMPVILAHHNLLPQALLRVDLYTELINGGGVRSRLCALGRSILYCHGHIHENPIEIIEDPRMEGSRLICIAAPELSKGFNLIKIEFNDKGVALGCTVRAFQARHSDGNIGESTIRIPLVSPISRSRVAGHRVPQLLRVVHDASKRFEEVREVITPVTLRKTTVLADLILESEWLGYVSVENRDQEPKFWHVRRTS